MLRRDQSIDRRLWLRSRALPVVLLAIGFWLWRMLGLPLNPLAAAGVALAAIVALVPAARRRVVEVLEKIRRPSARQRAKIALAIAIISTFYLVLTGVEQGRDFIPKFHDEHRDMLETQILARGRLWMPEHPMADFFETFHVLVKPVYVAAYFPGDALAFVPGVWLHLPFWVMPAVISGSAVGLLYTIITQLIDGVSGLLAALLLLSLKVFRYLSLIVMPHTVMLLLGLLVVWAYLRWRTHRSIAWAIAIGAFAGWGGITRPLDALCYAVPVGIAILLDLRGMRWPSWFATIGMIVLAAAPFLTLQLIMDKGVTGKYFQTPYGLYASRFSPDLTLGFVHFDAHTRPKTKLRQKLEYFEKFTLPQALRHRPENLWHIWSRERLPLIAAVALPATALLVLLPLGLLNLGDRRWVLWLMPILFICGYVFFPYLMAHYCVVPAPGIILGVLLGKDVVERLTRRGRNLVVVFLTLAIGLICLSRFPEIDRSIKDDGYSTPMMVYSHTYLPTLVDKPALVLFKYRPGASVYTEPVYNESVAWPDDAAIVRAQDLGPARDREIVDYYARIQPERNVYILDRGNLDLRYFGTAGELARQFASSPSPASRPVPNAGTR